MADTQWKYWQDEIKRIEAGGAPIDEHRQSDENATISGYWRVLAAKMKHDWPLILWKEEGQDLYTVQWGGGRPRPLTAEEEAEFRGTTFLKCRAVRRIEFTAAVERGTWPDDNKISRPTSTEEKLGIDTIASTPADQGGNQAPTVDEDGNELDPVWDQIKEKLEAAIADARKLPMKFTTQAEAEAGAAIRDKLLPLGKMGEARRKVERQPWDDGAAKVQAKYVPTLKPASELSVAILERIDAWQKAEQRRLEGEERERRRLEAKRIADEEAARLRTEAEARAAEAAAKGEDAGPGPTDAEIEAQAQQTAAAAVAAEPMPEIAKPVVQGTAFSRAASKGKKRVGVITDVDAFIGAIKDQADFRDWLQDKANKLARSETKLAGMTIEVE